METIDAGSGSAHVWSVQVARLNNNFDLLAGSVTTFVNADLVDNLLTVSHELGQLPASITIYDDSGQVVTVGKSATITQVILDMFSPISGTWTVVLK